MEGWGGERVGRDGRVRRANVQGIECWASSVSIEEEVGVMWLQ